MLGRELRNLHLLLSPVMDDGDTTFPEVSSNIVENLSYTDNKVWINDTQYFGNVPKLAGTFTLAAINPPQSGSKTAKAEP